jgi:hypothetical protein
MTRTVEDGAKAACPGCRHPIEHRESAQVVDDGQDIWHSDCYKMQHGERSAMTEREARDHRVQRWAHFDRLPSGPHGARRIA